MADNNRPLRFRHQPEYLSYIGLGKQTPKKESRRSAVALTMNDSMGSGRNNGTTPRADMVSSYCFLPLRSSCCTFCPPKLTLCLAFAKLAYSVPLGFPRREATPAPTVLLASVPRRDKRTRQWRPIPSFPPRRLVALSTECQRSRPTRKRSAMLRCHQSAQ